VLTTTKRLLVGHPLRSERMGETLLPKRLALPVFCSDPLSSNAYATEEMLRALSLGGLALFFLTPWVAAAVNVLLTVVVISYRQTFRPIRTAAVRTPSAETISAARRPWSRQALS
jgi:hypothetical protein